MMSNRTAFLVFFLVLHDISFCVDLFTNTQRDQIKNSVFWGAFGDAFGAPIEFNNDIDSILNTDGWDRDFLDDNYGSVILNTKRHYGNKYDYCPYTDDTRMSLLVLQELLNNTHKRRESYVFQNNNAVGVIIQIAHAFKKDSEDTKFGWIAPYRAPGIATENAIKNLSQVSNKIDEIFLPRLSFKDPKNNTIGGGCGSVMHAAPFGYFKNFCDIAAYHSKITHNHPIAIAACASLAKGIWMMIHEGKTNKVDKDEIIETMINISEKYEQDSISPDDLENNRYELRMGRILKTAVRAAEEMHQVREKYYPRDPYQVPFHDLMKIKEFKEKHIQMFPDKQWQLDDYTYDTSYFSGWDAATCLAIALYNFSLWIPKNVNELSEKEQLRCLNNTITSAMCISGDSDSAAAVTGQLCGAFFKSLAIPEGLIDVIEDGEKIDRLINEKEVDFFSNSAKTIENKNDWSKKNLLFWSIGIGTISILSWFIYSMCCRKK